MTEQHIVAMGGGGLSLEDPRLERYVIGLVDADRPKVCFVGTASGDEAAYELRFFRVMTELGCEPTTLRLFNREVADLRSFVLSQDIVFVGGGNTANLLAVWRQHGLDEVLKEAWDAGVVLTGSSAGANCWFQGSTTDSFLLGNADALDDGLGLLEGSFCPHYDSETERRPRYRRLVAAGELPGGIACDDDVAAHFIGTDLHAAVSARREAAAYRVLRAEGQLTTEEPLPVHPL